jgi:hypothetical protein
MTVEFVGCDRVDTFLVEFGVQAVVSHAITHFVADITDNCLVLRLLLLELLYNDFEIDQQLSILLFGPVTVEMPAIDFEVLVEVSENGLLGLCGDGGVIFNSVEAAQDKVEEADRDQELGVELQNDSGEAATG